MLLVFNDQTDAQLYFDRGHLVAATSGSSFGPDCLTPVLLMREGEFEFTEGIAAGPAQCTPEVHEMMMAATKEYFEREIRTRRIARQASAEEEPRLTSGVHRVATAPPQVTQGGQPAPTEGATAADQTASADSLGTQTEPAAFPNATQAAPPVPSAQAHPASATMPLARATPPRPDAKPAAPPIPGASPAGPAASPSQRSRPLGPGELGSASLDATGHLLQRVGDFSPQDLVVSALALRIAGGLGRLLGGGELQRFEVHGTGDKALLCDASKGTVLSVKLADTGDPDAMWEQVRS